MNFYLTRGFHRTLAAGGTCQQRMLTPPHTRSCPTLGLGSVLMLRPFSPELVLFLDFWVSNIPHYFCFAFDNMLQDLNSKISFDLGALNSTIRPNKVCVFPVSWLSLFFPSDSKTYYCVWVSNHQNLEIDSYVFLLKIVWWLVQYACKALHKQSAVLSNI